MSTASLDASRRPAPTRDRARYALRNDVADQSFWLLRIGLTVAPIAFGADKFANVMVNWEKYLAPWIRHLSPLSATNTVHVVGAIEILAGIVVAIRPRYGA